MNVLLLCSRLVNAVMAKMYSKVHPESRPQGKNNVTRAKISDSIRPISLMCKIMGIMPFSIRKQRELVSIESKKKDWLYFLFYFVSYIGIATYSMLTVKNDTQNFNVVPKIFVETECGIMVILELLTTLFAFVFRAKVCYCLRLLADIDVIFENINVDINYKRMYKVTIALVCTMTVSVTVRSILMLTTVDVDALQQLTLFVATFIKSLLKYQFIVYVLLLKERYKKINAAIKMFYKPKPKEIAKFQHVNEVAEKLYILCRLHYKLCNISRILNTAFAFQLLLSIGVSLYDILFQSYYLYVAFSGRVQGIRVNMIASAFAWLFDEEIEVYLLVYACASTSDCAKKIAVILHELRNGYNNPKLENHVQMYSLQMLHQRIEFSALGFFAMDYTLIYSIIGAVTTYLVIFIQFDQNQFKSEVPPERTVTNTSLILSVS